MTGGLYIEKIALVLIRIDCSHGDKALVTVGGLYIETIALVMIRIDRIPGDMYKASLLIHL